MRSANKNRSTALLSDHSGRSAAPLRVAVVGAGAIGCYLGTVLAQSPECEVIFIGRERMALEAAAYGLTAQDLNGACHRLRSPAVYTEFEALRTAQLVLVHGKGIGFADFITSTSPLSVCRRFGRGDAKWCSYRTSVSAALISTRI